MDALSAIMMTFGIASLVASWVVLLINSSNEDFTWGLCTALLPPLSYCYGLLRLDIAGSSLVLAFVGCVLVLLGIA